jgi:thiol-disulfide isomerase/thioredoxin
MAVNELDDSTFPAAVAGAPLAVVDFHATWCGPCIMFKPKFARISNDFPGVRFFVLDGEKAPEARKTVKIDNLPYFGVYQNGVLIEGMSTSSEEAFRALLARHVPAAGA